MRSSGPLPRFALALALGLPAYGLVACGDEPAAPAIEQVWARIAEAEEAAQAGNAGTVVAMLSEGYVGDAASEVPGMGGLGTSAFRHTRQSAAGAIHAVLGRYERVNLHTRVADVEITDPDRARATVFVAMSARPIDAPQALSSREVSLYRFDVLLALEDGAWLVVEASWRRAQPGDFL